MVTPKPLCVALQGGGSHGAYAWGVLDALLADPRITLDSLSGASAGAINAAILISGYSQGGRHGARRLLQEFWHHVAALNLCSPLQTLPEGLPWAERRWNLDHLPSYALFQLFSRVFSPYQLNPFQLNPLRPLLASLVDPAAIATSEIPLYVIATRVRDGQPKLFSGAEVTVDALLASACLPLYFPAVTIDGEDYWDGGYTANPAIWPLIYHRTTPDVVLIQITPLSCAATPTSASAIINRLHEISFNSNLISEMRAIGFVSRLIDEGKLNPNEYKRTYIHMISDGSLLPGLNASSRLNADWAFLHKLKEAGAAAARTWLEKHFGDIGQRSSIDLGKTFFAARGGAVPTGKG